MRSGTISYIIIGINVLVFLMETVAGGSEKTAVARRFGAMYSGMPSSERWRYLTSVFVHFGPLHLLCNMYSLYNLGKGIEYVFGPAGFLIIYLLSGLCGSLLTEIIWKKSAKRSISAGASGAVFGLLGAYVLLGLSGRLTSAGMRSVLICLAINVLYGTSNRRINMAAHAGGFAGGFVSALALFFLR